MIKKEKTLEQKLAELESITALHELIQDQEWTFGEFYVADFSAHIAGSIRKMFGVWKVSDLPELEPHGLKEDMPNFKEAELQDKMIKGAMEILKDMTVEDANTVLNTFLDAIGKEKARKLGPITLKELGIKFPSKEDLIAKHEASQNETAQSSDAASV